MPELYEKMKNLFGEKMTNDILPELGIRDTLIKMTATIQILCDILIIKGIITKEEYLEYFSNEVISETIKHFIIDAIHEGGKH